MKKIIAILLSIILGVTLFVGCGDKKEIINNNEKKITANVGDCVDSGEIYDVISKVYKNIEIQYAIGDSNEKRVLQVKVKLDNNEKTPEKISNEFNSICKDIIEKTNSVLMEYKDLEKVEFTPVVKEEECKASFIVAQREEKEFKIVGLLTNKEDFVEYKYEDNNDKVETDNINKYSNISKNEEIAEVPDNDGVFKAPKLLESLNKGNTELKTGASSFEVINEDGKKVVKVNLIYKNKVLVVGIVKNIRNNIESAFKNQCDQIDLSITQEHPMDLFECKYEDGSWDKEIN